MPKVFILPLYSKIPCGQDGYGDTAWKSVRDILAEKHPPGQAAVSDFVLESIIMLMLLVMLLFCLNSLLVI